MGTTTPNPSTWVVEPHLINSNTALMVATTASGTLDSGLPGEVAYGFTQDSTTVWQFSPAHQPSGLAPGTTYSYTVKTRLPDGLPGDASGEVAFTTPTLETLTYSKFKNESLIST